MKRALVVLLVVSLSAGLLSGCGGAAGTAATFAPSMDTSASADVEIVGMLDNFESLEAIIQEFNEVYPNVSVHYSKMDDYSSTMISRVIGSDPPEIFMSLLSNFESNSALADATLDMSSLGLDLSILTPENAAVCYYNGRLVRVPLMLNYQGAAVNTTLLEKEGLSLPTTHEEFLSVCNTLLAKGYTPLQGYPSSIYSMLLFNAWRVRLARDANAEAIFEALNTGADGSGEYLRESFELLADYREKGYFDDAVNSAIENSYDAAILHFFEGDTPFLICNSETVSGMKKRETKSEAFTAAPFDYEFCVLPVSDLGAVAVVDVWKAFSIAKNSENAAWAGEFLRFLFTADHLNEMAKIKGMPTVVAAGSDDSRFASLRGLAADQVLYSSDANVSSAVSEAYKQLAIQVCTGACTADDAVARFPALVRETLAAAK